MAEKAFIEPEQGEHIPCSFNPSEFSISMSNRWEGRAIAGRVAPDLQFVGGNAGTMDLELTFDTTETGNPVTQHTEKLLALMKVDSRAPGYDADTKTGRPLWCRFHWGSMHSFKAIIESLDLTFLYFTSDGKPLRARSKLRLRQFEQADNWGPQNPTSGTPTPHQVHQVQVGETLDRIAARYYGDSTVWRAIADTNNIANPLAIEPGTLLALPAWSVIVSIVEGFPVVDITVNGAPLASLTMDALLDVRVEQDLNLPSRFELRFADDNFAIIESDLFALGGEVTVAVNGSDLIRGVTTSVTVDLGPTGAEELIVAGLDKAHKLARRTQPTAYMNLTADGIIQKIATSNGLTVSGRTGASATLPYLLHCRDDYELVDTLVRNTGCEWWVEGTMLHVQKLEPSQPVAELTWGENILSFRIRQSAVDNVSTVSLRSWDHETQQAIVGQQSISAATAGMSTNTTMMTTLRSKARQEFASERTISNRPVPDAGTARLTALSVAQRAVATQIVAKGEILGNATLKAGSVVRLAKPASAAGPYVLTHVEHMVGPAGYVTRFTSGGSDPSEMVDLLGGTGGPAAALPLPWGQAGVVVGLVTNNRDPKNLGRVKVKFPTLGDQVESDWARVASIGAGPQQGLTSMPEVNDEVIISFEHGDLQRPVVLGAVWSNKNKPAGTANDIVVGGKVVKRSWQSSKGHLFEFVDKEGPDAMITLALGDGSGKILMTPNGVKITTTKTIELEGKQGIKLTSAAGKVEISGQQGVTVTAAAGDVGLDGVNTSVKAKVNFTAEGAMSKVIGKGNLAVESSGITQVKGSLLKLN